MMTAKSSQPLAMKKIVEILHFVFVATPVFLIVISGVYVFFFFYDMYNLLKKLYAKVS